MAAKILNGKKIAQEILEEVSVEVTALKTADGIQNFCPSKLEKIRR